MTNKNDQANNQQLNNSTQQSTFSKANGSSASEGIPHILWYLRIHYHVHNSPQVVPVLSQINPLHTLQSNLFKIHFNIILLSMPKSSKWYLSFRFPHQNPVCISLLPCTQHMPSYMITPIMFGGEYKLWNFSLCNFLFPLVTFLLSPNNFLYTLFLNTLSQDVNAT